MSTIPRHHSMTSAVRAAFTVCVIVLFGLPSLLDAQEGGQIQGTVTAQTTGEPLTGAQVYIEGTELGTLTRADGRYLLLNVTAGTYEVTVQMIGYAAATESVTLAAGETATVNFDLSATAFSLEELVVTGTAAEVRRKEVGNSLDAITSQQIEVAPVTTAEEALAGRAPGVTFMQNTGQPGAAATIKIRGVSTISQEAVPLIYVDGVRIFNEPTRAGWGGRAMVSPLQDIAAEDIARIEIVKGAAATTLYGTEAAAGVIQIFTKRGVAGDPIWNAELSLGMKSMAEFGPAGDPTSLYTQCGMTDQMFGLDLTDNYGEPGMADRVYWVDPTCPSDGDWFDSGPQHSMNLSVRGGSEDVTYYVSGNYGNSEGVLPVGYSKDGGFRGNFSFAPFDDISFQVNSAYTRRNTRWVEDGNNADGFLLNVGRGYRGYFQGGKTPEDCAGIPTRAQVCSTNGYLFESQLLTQTDHFTLGFTTNWDPTPGLTNRFAVGWDYNDIYNETTAPYGYLGEPEGYYWDEQTKHTKLSLDYAGSFRNNFMEELVSTFSWGAQAFRDFHRWTEIDVSQFPAPGEPDLLSGADRDVYGDYQVAQTNAGVFLQEMLGWRDLLFVTAGLRVDGNSSFGDDFGLQPYPKLSVAYIMSDHDFWPSAWWETFKLRGAVGESGKAPGAFARLFTWAPVSADEGEPGVVPSIIGNPDLGPERTREYEVGFDASWLAGKLGLEATYFHATTSDALLSVPYSPSTGLSSQTRNVGELVNEGYEFQVTVEPIRTENISWRNTFNVSFLDSEVIELGESTPADGVYTGLKSYMREGYQAPSYFGTKIMNPNEFADPITKDTLIGPVYPTQLIGYSPTIDFLGRFSLSALFEHQGGHYITNYTGYQNARRGVWKPCYDVQLAQIAADNGDPSALSGFTAKQRGLCSIDDYDSDYWLEPADFTKLRSLSLTMNVPSEWISSFANTASLTLAGTNLYMWSDYTGTDPEVQDVADSFGDFLSSGDLGRRDYYQIPPSRSFLLTFRFGF